MSIVVSACKFGLLERAVEILAGMSNDPTRQINIGEEKIRWQIHNYYWRRRP